ncbi:MAG: Rrf2 family transcriptional regulator, partial [Aeromonas veronii]
LVSSVRGPGGGYRLGLAPGEISVGQVITAVDESVDATKCLGKGGCHGGTQCLTHSLWRDLSERISSFLGDITLAELVGQADVRRIAGKQDEQMKTVLSLVDRAEHGDVSLKVQL